MHMGGPEYIVCCDSLRVPAWLFKVTTASLTPSCSRLPASWAATSRDYSSSETFTLASGIGPDSEYSGRDMYCYSVLTLIATFCKVFLLFEEDPFNSSPQVSGRCKLHARRLLARRLRPPWQVHRGLRPPHLQAALRTQRAHGPHLEPWPEWQVNGRHPQFGSTVTQFTYLY